MKPSKLRTLVAGVVFVILAIGLIVGINMGTLSGFGWGTISALCPLGAFTTMISTKTIVPRAVVSIVIMAALVFVVGRAFCAWICPVSLIEKIRAFFRSPKKRKELEKQKRDEAIDIAKYELSCASGNSCATCHACKKPQPKLDSRHFVLGGALLSTAIFGFPVFCLICPIGLTFATVLVIWRLFAFGDLTVSAFLIPAMLVIEMLFLRKWCSRWCPMGALMNLMSRFSKTLKPTIDESKCIETTRGVPCSRCAMVCEHEINLRHPEYGEHTLADCTRCFTCIDNCPASAISMPLIYKKPAKGETAKVTLAENEE